MARYTVNMKIAVEIDTALPLLTILAALDGFYSQAKQRIRQLKPPGVTIVRWHYHLSTGSVDEPEA